MRIGIDFDNTLVCYDQLFWKLARACGSIDESVPQRKDAVRDIMRQRGLESQWTTLQGQAYGPRIEEASPFPDAIAAVIDFRQRGWDVFVVSHKTRSPIAGAAFDLHEAARNWLIANGLLGNASAPILSDQVFFELTKRNKLQRISELECDCFIDDLPELLTDPEFPPQVRRILFDPHNQADSLPADVRMFSAWRDAAMVLSTDSRPSCA